MRAMLKPSFLGFLILFIILLFTGCSSADAAVSSAAIKNLVSAEDDIPVEISMSDSGSSCDSPSVEISGNNVKISQGGTYSIHGKLSDGQLVVKATDDADVHLIFDNLSIASSYASPVLINPVSQVTVTLKGPNRIMDERPDEADMDDPAALYCMGNLKIRGSGSLYVKADYKSGIYSDQNIDIEADMQIHSVSDAIASRGDINYIHGSVSAEAGNCGLKTSDQGSIKIAGGELSITAGAIAMHAANTLEINGGRLYLVAGGGDRLFRADSPRYSNNIHALGLSANSAMLLDGGDISISSAGQGIFTEGSLSISGGSYSLSVDGSAVYAKQQLTINDCEQLVVANSYNGIQSSNISVSHGKLHIISDNYGVCISDDADSYSDVDSGGMLTFNGGSLYISSDGSGIFSTGGIALLGGKITLDVPENSGSNTLHYNSKLNLSSGNLTACNTDDSALPADSSSQGSIALHFNQDIPAHQTVALFDSSGSLLAEYSPKFPFESVLFSSPAISFGGEYVLKLNDNTVTSFTAGSSALTIVEDIDIDGLISPVN